MFFLEVISILQCLPLQFNHTSVVLVLNAFDIFLTEGIYGLLALTLHFIKSPIQSKLFFICFFQTFLFFSEFEYYC